jgi:hypothetical protein
LMARGCGLKGPNSGLKQSIACIAIIHCSIENRTAMIDSELLVVMKSSVSSCEGEENRPEPMVIEQKDVQ